MRTQTGMWLLSAAVMLGLSGLAGCGGEKANEFRAFDKGKDTAKEAEVGHAHVHGPHDGELIDLGEVEFHAEVVFDEEKHKITLYLLGADAKTPVAIEAKELSLELPGKEAPATHALTAVSADADGKASHFEITSEELVETFHKDPKTVGKFKVSINGKEFVGEVKHMH